MIMNISWTCKIMKNQIIALHLTKGEAMQYSLRMLLKMCLLKRDLVLKICQILKCKTPRLVLLRKIKA